MEGRERYHGPWNLNSSSTACFIQYSLVEYGTLFTVFPDELRNGVDNSVAKTHLSKGTSNVNTRTFIVILDFFSFISVRFIFVAIGNSGSGIVGDCSSDCCELDWS